MGTQEAIEFLAKKGIKVVQEAPNVFRIWDAGGQPHENYHRSTKTFSEIFTGREVVKFSRAYKDSTQQTTIHKSVKKFSNDKDRTATRDAIQTEDFDKIPSKQRTKEDDIWRWS